ncbi:MAG: threonine-phosphate decarboxylase CobD [Peptococcaceae bacterium]|nr:threonine-phosphate decarboxylase CobD [Peptococcaceae bacterium]
MSISDSSHGGNIGRAAREYGLSEKQIIDFSASINPLGPAPGVYRAVTEALWRIKHYPDPGCGDLPRLLADYLGVGRENLLLGNGGAELIYILPRALKIRRALVAAPTFSEYARAVEAAGGRVRYITLPVSGTAFPAGEAAGHLAGCDAVFLCNPNNPTGQLFSPGDLMPLLDAAEGAGAAVVVDEAFMDFVAGREDFTLMPLACARRNLVVLYSMTKFFGIPGLRLGAAVACPEVIGRLKQLKDPWSVNALARVAGEAALRDESHMAETLKTVKEEREYLFSTLSSVPGLRPFPSEANFLLVDVSGTGMKSAELVEKLAAMGILVRNCANFYGLNESYIRVAVKTRPENESLVRALEKTIRTWLSGRPVFSSRLYKNR